MKTGDIVKYNHGLWKITGIYGQMLILKRSWGECVIASMNDVSCATWLQKIRYYII